MVEPAALVRPIRTLLAVIAGLLLGAPALAHATTYTFRPSADARVNLTSPSTNYGGLSYLSVQGYPPQQSETFLRFPVTGLDGPVASAVVRLHVNCDDSSADGPAIYPTSGAWTEGGVTWNNRPTPTGAAYYDAGRLTACTWVDFPVTGGVSGEATYNFELKQSSTEGDASYFGSRESSDAPQLVVTTNPAPTPPPAAAPPPLRFMYNDASASAGYGFNVMDVGSKSEADATPSGTKGQIWVGDYDNATCQFQVSDAQIESRLLGNNGDPKIAGYFFSDEPDPTAARTRRPSTPRARP